MQTGNTLQDGPSGLPQTTAIGRWNIEQAQPSDRVADLTLLSSYIRQVLKFHGIETIGQLLEMGESTLLRTGGIGRKSAYAITAALAPLRRRMCAERYAGITSTSGLSEIPFETTVSTARVWCDAAPFARIEVFAGGDYPHQIFRVQHGHQLDGLIEALKTARSVMDLRFGRPSPRAL